MLYTAHAILTCFVLVKTGNFSNISDTGGHFSSIHFLLAWYVLFMAFLIYLLSGFSSCKTLTNSSMLASSLSEGSNWLCSVCFLFAVGKDVSSSKISVLSLLSVRPLLCPLLSGFLHIFQLLS